MDAVTEAVAAASRDPYNAFTAVHEDARSSGAGPLAGVPIAVKDLIDDAGHVTTCGSAFYRAEAQTTAPALQRLRDAGAAVVGRTGLHEFAFGFSSENPWFGPVRNPWDPDLSPGGSSGGSAAAVAGGVVPIALGTDTGGSVRVPAALCGIYGLKVTHGLIPLQGVFPLVASFDTVGALTRTLSDLETATALMAGPDWPDDDRDPGGARLVVPQRWIDDAPMSGEVETAFDEFLGAAAEIGFPIEHRELESLTTSHHQLAVIAPEVASVHRRWREEGRPYGQDVGERIDGAIRLSEDADALAEGQRWRRQITELLTEVTSGDRVVVTPSVAAMDKRIGDDRIGDHHYRTVISWFSAPVNPTGHPAISLPLAGEGRRPAIQIIGSRRSEPFLLSLARRLEERRVVGLSRLPSG